MSVMDGFPRAEAENENTIRSLLKKGYTAGQIQAVTRLKAAVIAAVVEKVKAEGGRSGG